MRSRLEGEVCNGLSVLHDLVYRHGDGLLEAEQLVVDSIDLRGAGDRPRSGGRRSHHSHVQRVELVGGLAQSAATH